MANPFSSEELDGGASQALRDPVTRFRLLGYVAQVRGMSTAEALTFIERRLFPEAGVNAVSRTTLRDVLDHLNSQHFNGPPKGTTMNSNSTLDQPIAGLFEHDQDLHRTLTAICVGLGEGQRAYPKVSDALHKGVGELGGRASVREALGFANLWPETDKVTEHLHLLERRDEELVTLEQEAFAALPEQRVDGLGNVLLDQAADHGLLLTDAGEFERRLARGRRLDNGRYAGPKGREAFAADDRLHIESGIDLLATGERNTAIRGVTQRTDQRRIQLGPGDLRRPRPQVEATAARRRGCEGARGAGGVLVEAGEGRRGNRGNPAPARSGAGPGETGAADRSQGAAQVPCGGQGAH